MEGSGAVNHSLPREGPPLPGLRAVERVSQPRMPVPASGSAVLRERSLPGAACALEPWVPRLRVAPVLFAYPAGAARKRLQPGGAWLGKVETPGGVQLPKAPPPPRCPGAKRRPRVSLTARKFSKLRADPPNWGESSGWPGAQSRDLSFHTLRGLAASRYFFCRNQASARTTSLSLVLG